MKYFLGSYIVTILGIISAYFWGEHIAPGAGLMSVFIVLVLSVLEVSLSFDNAVINAVKLEKLPPEWQHRFLTWGILIAVFGMRFVFPVLIVAIFAKLSLIDVTRIALTNSSLYAHYLHQTHAPIVAFGGCFLLMLFLHYFFNQAKDLHWIKWPEQKFQHCANIEGIEAIIALSVLLLVQHHVEPSQRHFVLVSGVVGIVIFLIIDGLTKWLECKDEQLASTMTSVANKGFIGFMYLEIIDASFSLDGVLGAFALSKDILIITIGLSIGAMFVRSLTIMLVEKKTLNKYLYLEHGAHWAIGALAAIMLISSFHEVPEVITGLIGLGFILAAYISSIVHNKKRGI